MIILGIETSCDETAAAVIKGEGERVEVLSNVVSSQIEIHKKYGGVVPEVAAREHVLNILPVVHEALEKAEIPLRFSPLTKGRCPQGRGVVDAIAVTTGPGLITSLLVGVETAKSLAYAWKLPLVAVNHIEGHIYANFISANSKDTRDKDTNKNQISNPEMPCGCKFQTNIKSQISNIIFPALILTVSGGHTSLVLMKGHGDYEVVGETRDDAAGEAFDKAAKLLELGYPGGPAISAAAEKFQIPSPKSQTNSKIQASNFKENKSQISLPRPMIESKDFDFSFSGLKTALLYAIQKDVDYKSHITNYCYEFQEAVVDVLVKKTIKAAKKYNVGTVMLSGGVAANARLRERLQSAVKDELPDALFAMPELKYTTDNAVMIAAAGYFNALRKNYTPWEKLRVDCNLKLGA